MNCLVGERPETESALRFAELCLAGVEEQLPTVAGSVAASGALMRRLEHVAGALQRHIRDEQEQLARQQGFAEADCLPSGAPVRRRR